MDKELMNEVGVLLPLEKGEFNQDYVDEILVNEIYTLITNDNREKVLNAVYTAINYSCSNQFDMVDEIYKGIKKALSTEQSKSHA